MFINNKFINANLTTIIDKLRQQMILENRRFLRGRIIEGPENIMIQCPYHSDGQERKPSMGIKKSDGICHCFRCDKVVNLPELISTLFDYNDYGNSGMQWLMSNFGIVEQEEREDVKLDYSRSRNNISNNNHSSNNKDNAVLITEEELDKYRVIHPYMRERGLTDGIIGIFDIGFDSDSNSITFPVKDIFGNTLFIGRRNVDRKYYHYPARVKKPVYGLYEVTQDKQPVLPFIRERMSSIEKKYSDGFIYPKVYITEGPFDMWKAWTFGVKAVSLLGLGTQYQFQQLLDSPIRHFVLATDMDEAGMKARERIKDVLWNHKICTELMLPDGKKDIGECTKEEFEQSKEVF